MSTWVLATLLGAAAAFAPSTQLPARASRSVMKMEVDEMLVGVQAPAGFYDPLGLVAKDGPEAFARRRAVERKHGRVSMAAITGFLIHNADIEFPGYLSVSEKIKFSDIPNGFKGIFAILAFFALVELAWWPASNYSGDYGCGFFGTQYEGEEKITKLNAELANGRLAMLAIAGAMFQEGQTGMTFAEQLDAGKLLLI
ncbi:hypothetical protein CTAYLR_005507 [Chrysophaeum taylorii]|uniref:Uncharacterized protein n=1 Tax=Chrysophaeum taylorii TaxID=2483200 RepID=A0AAD7U5B9_9STRA|nr:hypothetical protein CTAYLR_005507 [Chrysophaeum taylorii]